MFKSFCRWSTSRIDCSGWLLDCSHSILSAFRGCHFYCVCRSSPFYVFTTLPSFIVMNRTSSSNYYFRDCLNNKKDVIGGGQFGCQDGQLFKEGIVFNVCVCGLRRKIYIQSEAAYIMLSLGPWVDGGRI